MCFRSGDPTSGAAGVAKNLGRRDSGMVMDVRILAAKFRTRSTSSRNPMQTRCLLPSSLANYVQQAAAFPGFHHGAWYRKNFIFADAAGVAQHRCLLGGEIRTIGYVLYDPDPIQPVGPPYHEAMDSLTAMTASASRIRRRSTWRARTLRCRSNRPFPFPARGCRRSVSPFGPLQCTQRG